MEVGFTSSNDEESKIDFRASMQWRIFRIMAEFVDGFEFLRGSRKEVAIFGSARLPETSPYYVEAVKVGRQLAEEGYTVITGGGPGIMEAGNRGAYEAGGESISINIELPFEERQNLYVKKGMGFRYFFTRKVMLIASAQAYIVFPGGYGTMDELMEVLNLIQTKKMEPVTIVLYGSQFWAGLIEWMKQQMLQGETKLINADALKLFVVVDDVESAMEEVRKSTEREVF